ncbi:DUF378 domain-containing protein [Neobacillus fumarioli]|uniref:DUF378 domain-containing protein n=1 Tax=Neobacillus fumarioli TaxID=105229 RepID=UPI0008317440|nr:DUF378 domain-containing protein [Neobacillus fumarioli]
MAIIQRIALVLTIIGAINWGLIGFFKFDLVGAIFGGQSAFLARVVFGLVGISGLACITLLFTPLREPRLDVERPRNHHYATEFGEENDLSKLKDE